MSTLKSDGIQPTLNTNNLIIRSGADVERLRIQPNGQILVASTTGTTFAGEVNFSNTIRIPGGVQVGGGIGPTRYTALDVVHTNAALGLPDAVNYNTTRSRSNMMIQASGSNTTLFFGNNSSTHAWLQVQNSDNNPYGLMLNPAGGSVIVGSFAGDTNVMAKPNMNAGSVGLVVPLLSSAGDLNSAGVYYVTSALSEGTWLVFLQGFENAGSTNDADPVWVMFKVWTVPAGNYLVFSPNNDTLSATGNSGVSYRMNTSSMQTYTTANSNTVKNAPWVQLTAPTDVTIAGTYNPAGTQTGIVWNGVGEALLVSGYAIRIA